MKKRYYLILIVVIICAIGFFILNDLNKKNPLVSIHKTEVLTFKNDKKVYVTLKSWGVTGNHEEIVLSETLKENVDKSTNYIFYTNEFFYKTLDDSLIIYSNKDNVKIPEKKFENIKISIINLENYDEIEDYRKNYNKYDLKKISIN